MFHEIRHYRQLWIQAQESVLNDCAVLSNHFGLTFSQNLDDFILDLRSCSIEIQGELFRNPIFYNWLVDLTSFLIEIQTTQEVSNEIQNTLSLGISLFKYSIALDSNSPSMTEEFYSELVPLKTLWADSSGNCKNLKEYKGIAILDRPVAILQDRIRETDALIDLQIDSCSWRDSLKASLDLIMRTDEKSFSLVSGFVSYVVPLQTRTLVQNLSFSTRTLPGVVFKNNENSIYVFAETLIHEADHQFFYALDNHEKLWI